MMRIRVLSGTSRGMWIILAAIAAASPAAAAPPTPAMTAPAQAPMPAPAGNSRINLLEVVRPEFHEAVLKCVRHPTVSTKSAGEEVICTVAVYEWLYDHPDRVALAWQRLKVPTVNITDLGNGKFAWTDENGSEVVWQTVGRFRDGRVWLASGKVKAVLGGPSVPIQATFIVSHPRRVEKDGVAVFTPNVQIYVHSDSKAAHVVLRLIGPTAPRLAEEAAGQLLDFFGGIAAVVQNHPSKAETLLAPPKK
jgi:hypothetical protein